MTYSEWATPIVPVAKPGGQYQICGDFKVTVNPARKIDQYPLPKVEDLSNLDLSQAYLTLICHKPISSYNSILKPDSTAPLTVIGDYINSHISHLEFYLF